MMHLNDAVQISRELYRALIVLEPGWKFDLAFF